MSALVGPQPELSDLSLLSSMPFALGITDADNRFIFTNQRFDELFGYDAGELIGKPGFVLNAPSDEDPAIVTERIGRAIEVDGVWTGEVYCQKKSGERFWTRARLAVHRHPVLGRLMVGMQEDIGPEKVLEAQLLHAQKLDALGTLAGGIAHEFNNLLSVIQGNLEMLALDPARGQAVGDDLEDVLVATRSAGELVGQILQFARKSSTHRRKLDPLPIIARACRLSEVRAGHARIELVSEVEEVELHANPTELHQVCLNLVNNALQALPTNGGSVEVRVETLPGRALPADVAAMELRRADEVFCLRVLDTGHGVPPELQSVVFDPFFTTKEAGKGTGLGLAVVARIVKNHEGSIVVRAREDVGTEFAVYLPVFDASTPSLSYTPRTSEGGPSGRLLIVEDQPSLARIFGRFLTGRGHQVEVCLTGDEALQCIETAAEPFELMITDLEMPGLSGLDLVDAVRKRGLDLPVVVTSGFADAEDRLRLHDLGVLHLLQKPVELTDLEVAVQASLGSDGG